MVESCADPSDVLEVQCYGLPRHLDHRIKVDCNVNDIAREKVDLRRPDEEEVEVLAADHMLCIGCGGISVERQDLLVAKAVQQSHLEDSRRRDVEDDVAGGRKPSLHEGCQAAPAGAHLHHNGAHLV